MAALDIRSIFFILFSSIIFPSQIHIDKTEYIHRDSENIMGELCALWIRKRGNRNLIDYNSLQ